MSVPNQSRFKHMLANVVSSSIMTSEVLTELLTHVRLTLCAKLGITVIQILSAPTGR